ncbi:family 78 glycoside hydrolase catalytic domain [Streptomyces sp. NPDC088812]|uniref:family 78 glycoside hydrolase catalytic domain n=1 Tax=Streptomyces sp. NPDC088812 TaxID=3365905 RepID=UPI0038231305
MIQRSCRDLRVEYLRRPLAVGAVSPRFSWIADHAQTAYRLVVTDASGSVTWDSGRVDSSETSLVAYAGAPLAAGADFDWRVESWSRDSVLQGGSTFGTAPDLDAWSAPWVEPVQVSAVVERWSLVDWIRGGGPTEPVEERLRPAHLLRQAFVLDEVPVRARLHMTARGVYTAWLGGERVGDEVLAPGFDSYAHRISVQTYDVTRQLTAGENVLAVALADGWWAGRIGLTGSSAQFGDRTSVTWELHAAFADGHTRVIRPGAADVRSTTGPWRYTDLFVGECYDARALPDGWRESGFDDRAWTPVIQRGADARALVPFRGEPVRRVQEIPARTVRATPEGWIADFGQVIAGRVRLTLPALPAGSRVVVEHTETLDSDGSWFVNIAGINKEQTDVFVADGEEAEWEPEFTFHGFRYARVRGVDELRPEDVVAVVLSSDLEQTGRFSTSDARLNRLHENVVWSQRANFLSIPTDCPQRERAGWTGDLQVFAPAAANIALVAPFVSRWLDNLRSDQRADGRVTITSPHSPFDAEAAEQATGLGGIVAAAGWSDAIAIVPWTLYERYGDIRVLEENSDAVLAWIGYQTRTAADELPAALVAGDLSPERRARQALLYNTGEHFGDWLTPSTMEGRPTHEAIGIAPALTSELVAPMFQAHTLTLASRTAEVLDRPEAAALAERAARVREAFAAEYVSADGGLPVRLQGMYALALGLDMIPDDLREAAGDRLAELVRERGNRLDTGFLSMPYLLDALWDTGHRDLARAVLWQSEAPSWLSQVDHGATTIWETWDAIAPDGAIRTMSFNHYAFGCVDDWLFRRVAGITPTAPGYRRVRIEPDLDAGVTRVDAAVGTPYGEIAVDWRRAEETVTVRVTVPFGVEATLVVAGETVPLGPGTTERAWDRVDEGAQPCPR